MYEYMLFAALALTALVFFVARRSISLFAWSRLETWSLPRARDKAIEQCLEERDLVATCFAVAGNAALVALVTLVAWKTKTEPPTPWAVAQFVLGALVLVWILPEFIAWAAGDKVVLYVAPALYKIAGAPFRAMRRILYPLPHNAAMEQRNGSGEAAEAAAGDAEAHEFFKEAVRLRHTLVREIMTPRTDMVSIASTATLRQAAELSVKTGTSRVPVYRENRDEIIGVLHVKDLLAYGIAGEWDQPGLDDLARPPYFVPETKTIAEIMEEFQRLNTHMGIVLDEYGGTSGVVTFEDVIEELIGEIRDEHEDARPEEALFKWLKSGEVEVQSVMRIEEFNDEFDFDLPNEEDFDTVGGFVMFALGKIPNVGESFRYSRAHFTVTEADARHVIRVRAAFAEKDQAKEST